MPTMRVSGPEEHYLQLCGEVFSVAAQAGSTVFAWYLSHPPKARSKAIQEGLVSLTGPKLLKQMSVEHVLRQFVTLSASGKLTTDHLSWFAAQDPRKLLEQYESVS